MIDPFSDEHFMKQALQEANKANELGEVPIGAVIVMNNQVIARAHNQVETLNDATAHAEMIALTSAMNALGSKYLPECSLYITLEPCPMCAGALFLSQLKNIFYGATDTSRGFKQLNPAIVHPKSIIKEGILEEECGKLLKDFFHKKRQ